jgi:excisionase family DNA binding protein
MGAGDSGWEALAACHANPDLDPDAWFQVSRGFPVDLGVKALTICQDQCPVSSQCYRALSAMSPREMIGGGGWWDAAGRWHHQAADRRMGVRQVARYLRVTYGTVERWVADGSVKMTTDAAGRRLIILGDAVAAYKVHKRKERT